jgi:putative dehydrogenase
VSVDATSPPRTTRIRLAVVGLGNIGIEIAHAVAAAGPAAGIALVAVDLDEGRRTEWSARGFGDAVPSLAQAAADGALDAIVLCVRLAEHAVAALAALPAGTDERPVFVVTTLRPADAIRLRDASPAGWRLVESPVSGGAARARAGDLVVMIAGDVRDGDVALLERTIASSVHRFEHLGQPAVAKLLNNALAAYNVAAYEALLAVGERAGLDARRLHAVFRESSGASWMTTHLSAVVMDLLVKDLDLARREFGTLPAVAPDASDALQADWTAMQARLRETDLST